MESLYSKVRRDESVFVIKQIALLHLFLCLSVSNYSHSSPHSSRSCRFCQVDIRELGDKQLRQIRLARSAPRPPREGGAEKHQRRRENKKRRAGDSPWVWALVSTVWQGVRRGCITGEGERGDHLRKTSKQFNLDAPYHSCTAPCQGKSHTLITLEMKSFTFFTF